MNKLLRLIQWRRNIFLNIRHKAHKIGNTVLYYMGETSKEQLEKDSNQKIYSITGKAGSLGVKFNIVIDKEKKK